MRILLVEDNADHRELMSLALIGHDSTWEVEGVGSGEEALCLLLGGEAFDLVFLDYSLPQRDGLWFLKEIRRGKAPPPVVMVTGRGDEQVAVEAMKGGAYDYVVKGEGYLQRLPMVAQRAVEANRLSVERKQADEKLRENIVKFYNLFNDAPVGYFEYDDQGHITSVNRTELGMLGYTREEMIGQPVWSFIVEKEVARDQILAKLAGIVPPARGLERTYRRKDGTTITCLVENRLFRNVEGRIIGIRSTIQDITERKRAEEKLNEANLRLQMLQQITASIHSTLDLEEVFRQITDSFVHSMGYNSAIIITRNGEKNRFEVKALSSKKWILTEVDKILGFTLINYSFPVDPGLNAAVSAAMRGEIVIAKTAAEIAYPFISKETCSVLQKLGGIKNYVLVPLQVDKEVVGGIIITSTREEVSEEEFKMVKIFAQAASHAIQNANLHKKIKQAEESLRESEARYRIITDHVDDIVWQLDLGLHFVYVSPAVERMLGYTPQEACGFYVVDFLDEDGLVRMRETIRNRLERKADFSRPKEYRMRHKDGHWVDVEVLSSPLFNAEGHPTGFVGITRDISVRKRAEERLTKLNECLLSFGADPTENINRLVALCGEQLRGTCALYNRLENGLLHSVGQWNTPPNFISFDKPDGHICFDLIRSDTSEASVIRNLQQTPYAKTDSNVSCYNLKTYIGKTVSFGDTIIGSLCVVYQEDYIHSEDDKKFLGIVASAIGVEEERKRVEKALRESEERYRSLFKNMINGYAFCKILVDEENKPVDFIYIDINDAFEKLTGLRKEDVIGKRVTEAIPSTKDLNPEIIAIYGEVASTGKAAAFEGFFKPLDIWLAISVYSPHKDYFVAIFDNITERKRAEEALRRSEENFRRSMDDLPLGVRIVTEEGETVYANQAILKIYGYDSIEELKTTPVKKRYTQESYAEFQIRREKRRRGEDTPSEYGISIVRENGEVRHLQVFRKEVLWNGQRQFQVIYQDITERKRAEEALQATKELFEKIFVSQRDAIFLLDAINPPTILDCNPAATEVFGYTRQEMLGRTMDFLHVDEAARKGFQRHFYSTILEDGYLQQFEFQMRRKDGAIFHTEHSVTQLEDEQGSRIGWVSVVRDVTESKRAREELMEREFFNLALFEYNPIQTIAVDLEGKVTGFNLAKRKSGDRFPNIGDVMYKDYAGGYEIDMYAEMMKCIRSGKEKEFPEQKYHSKILSITISPFPKGAVIISQDITGRKQAEEKIHTYQEDLRSLASELSLIEERERRRIATDLHDHISQTLAIAKIKLGMAQGLTSSTDWVGSLNEIGELIDQAIQYTRSLTFELSPPILYEMGLEAGIEWLTEQIEEKHDIQIGFEDDGQPKPMSEEIRIALFKATKELLINIVKHAQASKAKVSIWREDPSIRIRVEDDGVGFSTSEGNALEKTTGFGLFNIRERLKYLGGDMVIESEPGRGTRVTLSAPLEENEDNK